MSICTFHIIGSNKLMIFYKINEKQLSHYSKDFLHLEQSRNHSVYFNFIKIVLIIIFAFSLYHYFNYTLNFYEIYNINEEENNLNKITNEMIEIEIDNKIEDYKYENDIDYSEFRTEIKSIAIYFPNIYLNKFRKIISLNDINKEIVKYYDISKEYMDNQNLSNHDKKSLENSYEYKFINNQIKLAKRHGIYGFGVYIYWFSGKIFFDRYINIFLETNSIDFHFLFILKNRNIDDCSHKNQIQKEYNKNKPEELIQKLKIFFLDKRYIKLGLKPALCIDNNLKRIKKLKMTIQLWRDEAKKIGIGELIIIGALNNKNNSFIDLSTIYNAGYQNLPKYLFNDNLLVNFKENTTFFSGLIYRDINFKSVSNFSMFRGSTLENKFKINKKIFFGDYHPEYFYIMNKKIIDWSKIYHKNSSNLIFVNAWNDYNKGNYLEPNPRYGFGSLNSISKALFNLSFTNYTYNLSNLINKNLIAVQVHIYYIDLIYEIINKTNNIPVQFDLYITTNTRKKKSYITEYINKYSKANNFKIKILDNNGRDVLPLLNQMNYIGKKYKYFCHIHSKKSRHDPKYGLAWRNYLYKNLLGNKEIISHILTEFENNEKLGFIFPETFYEAKVHALKLPEPLKKNINFLINSIFPGYKMGKTLDFPAGNMFWAKFQAVYQAFRIVINKDLCKEGKPLTILYALERIWLYIVKMNGFYYKTICGDY